MEMRHTIEILVKDIQDIEKLVANLQNYDRSAIEMDLALSKLRNVYEVLAMIRDDRYRAASNGGMTQTGTEAEPPAATNVAVDPGPDAGQPPATPEEAPMKAVQHPAAPEEVSLKAVQHPATPEEPSLKAGQPPATPEEDHPENSRMDGGKVDSGKVENGRMDGGNIDSGKVAAILAEKFSREASINENMANQRNTSMESRLAGKSIDNIARNIGINDRFMIIRELFSGNSEEYSRLIRNLDEAGDYEKAVELIREQFPSSMDHDGVGILISLTRRRFVRA